MMGKLRCWAARNLLDLYVDGRLDAAQAARVAAHLGACPACGEEAAALGPLPGMKSAPPALPAGLAESILRRYREEDLPAAPAWRLTPAQAAGLAVVALLALAQAVPGPATQGLKAPPVEASR